ncbi:hypothetical protein AYI69_g10311 [Smittium culicis]|uniref:Uncharacterized protein n=1 Tax=Smittium culicis TaxID=133412 RepID=A0A1R1X6R5_9FUNG|nr:hypothetical protein AYI69_g10311 [Smittium culicis]
MALATSAIAITIVFAIDNASDFGAADALKAANISVLLSDSSRVARRSTHPSVSIQHIFLSRCVSVADCATAVTITATPAIVALMQAIVAFVAKLIAFYEIH